jgi:predicted nucleotidyltransferase
MNDEQLKTILQEVFASARRIFGDGLSEVILYGAYARGETRDGSAIDVMVLVNVAADDLDRYRSQISEAARQLGEEHDVEISVSVDDAAFFHNWKEDIPFYRTVWNEGVKVTGEPGHQ